MQRSYLLIYIQVGGRIRSSGAHAPVERDVGRVHQSARHPLLEAKEAALLANSLGQKPSKAPGSGTGEAPTSVLSDLFAFYRKYFFTVSIFPIPFVCQVTDIVQTVRIPLTYIVDL